MEEIINYIMKTPENTNGNILREQLKGIGFDESNIEEAIGLIMGNLGSLNWNILRERLESLDGSGSSAKTRRVLFEEELTTSASGSIAVGPLPSITNWPFDNTFIIVTIDGNEYELPKGASESTYGYTTTIYGDMAISDPASSFVRYPCAIIVFDPEQFMGEIGSFRGMFETENPGTYSIKIEVEE